MKTLLFLAAVASLALASPGGATASTRNFIGISLPPPAPSSAGFNAACGVAESGNGFLYVSDYYHRFVDVYDAASGELIKKIASPEAENSPCDLAVDPGAAHLYANLLHQGVVDLIGAATIDSARSTGVALSPTDGTVYVAHRTNVSVYGPGGSPSWGSIGSGGALEDAYGIAVSGYPATLGYVYVGDAATDTIKVFDPATDTLQPVAEIDGAGTPSGDFSDLTDTDLAIDPTNGDLLVVDDLQTGFEHPIAVVDEFAPDGSYVGQISHWSYSEVPPAGPPVTTNRFLVHSGPTGLAFSPDGRLFMTSGNELESVLYRFAAETSATAPLSVSKAGAGSGRVVSGLPGLATPTSTGTAGSFTGIECGLICATEYVQGAAPILTAVPSPHSIFTGWSVAGDPAGCPGTGTCQLTVAAATEVTANFDEAVQRTLTVAKAGTGAGRVISSPAGLDCGIACSADFDQGTQLKLLAESAPGSHFSGWSGACSGSGTRCQLTMGEDAATVAEFTLTDETAGRFSGTVAVESPKTVGANLAPGSLLALGAARQNGDRVVLTATAAASGTLTATAKLLKPVRLRVPTAGVVKVALSLNGAGRKALARARRGRLRLQVKLAFVSSGGADLQLTRMIGFKDRRKR